MKVGKIDPVAHTITSATIGYGLQDTISYYAFNLLEEVGQPGDWYLNRKTGLLYWYPAGDPNKTVVEISSLTSTMLKANNVDGLRIEGLQFDCGRNDAIETTGSSNCTLINCKITRLACDGIVINGGNNNLLVGCDLNTIGKTACDITGGNRQTLESSGDIIANCRFSDFGRIVRTYTPAIHIGMGSVGIHVVHNDFTHCPAAAMRIEGNDHLIEFNRFHDLLEEKNDEGIIDIWGNPTYRGIVFRYNIFENVGPAPMGLPINLRGGIRFDDIISGMLVYGNIFYRASIAGLGGVQINCGRDNVIDNNVFIDCKIGISGGYGPRNAVWSGTLPKDTGSRTKYIYSDLYMQRYPDLVRVADPVGTNFVWRNAFVNCGTSSPKRNDLVANTVVEGDSAFVDHGHLSDRIDDAAFEDLGMRPIPYRRIGAIAK